MLGARLATAAVAIPILIAIIFAGPPVGMSVLIFALGSIAVVEYMAMAFPVQATERRLGNLCGIMLLAAASFSRAPGMMVAAASVAAIGLLLTALVLRPVEMRDGLRDGATSWLGIAYVGILAHFVWLHHLADGPYWVAFVVGIGMAGDTGAYFSGRTYGRHKLMPRVSPGKTVEGAVGNLFAAVAASALLKVLFFPEESWLGVVLLALVLTVFGQLGDLCESAIKRAFGSKESGAIFPGHGGVLDRIDSLLFPVAILYYYRALF